MGGRKTEAKTLKIGDVLSWKKKKSSVGDIGLLMLPSSIEFRHKEPDRNRHQKEGTTKSRLGQFLWDSINQGKGKTPTSHWVTPDNF